MCGSVCGGTVCIGDISEAAFSYQNACLESELVTVKLAQLDNMSDIDSFVLACALGAVELGWVRCEGSQPRALHASTLGITRG